MSIFIREMGTEKHSIGSEQPENPKEHPRKALGSQSIPRSTWGEPRSPQDSYRIAPRAPGVQDNVPPGELTSPQERPRINQDDLRNRSN